jgi:hypothetical protein
MHYDISQPVDTIFNCIDDLSDLADHAMSPSPMTDQQMVDLAYVIFAKQPLLQPDLRLWNKRPAVERTYANFVQHLRDAHSDLSALPTAGDVCHQQPPHHANLATIADLVLQRILEEQGPPPVEQPPHIEPPPVDSYNEVANSLQRREIDLQSREAAMRTQMQDMMSSMMNNNNNNNNNGNGNSNRNNGNRNNRNNGNRNNGNGNRNNGNRNNGNNDGYRNGNNGNGNNNNNGNGNGNNNRPTKCCHAHGACAHDSSGCRTPAQGHQNAATFSNMMDGSTNGCFWL